MTKVQRFGHANWCLYAPGGKSRCICGTVKYNPPIADTQSKPAPEGVAAPLEPTQTSRNFLLTKRGYSGRETIVTSLDKLCSDLDEWAAAVSNNLQEELAAEKASVEQLCGDLKAIQKDYTNEKKRAENLREELAEINRVIMERFGELKCSTKDDEGNQLDASDLVCILATRLELSRQNFAKAETRISGLEKEIAALREKP